MHTLSMINYVIAVVFTVCYSYQFFYIVVPWLFRRREPVLPESRKEHRFAVLICARNEGVVIGDLLRSIRAQSYPADRITPFVLADNCTDDTAEVAEREGAVVYRRENHALVGKSYALEELMGHLHTEYPGQFDGFFVFDADNILAPDYIEQMDRSFTAGNEIITSYRNSKNYGSNWISAGYALWFLRESRYLNHARYLLGTSCAVSGTGFFFSRAVAEEVGGWPFHMLTEDIEFSINQIVKGRKIAFCRNAELFDEQPVLLRQSWRQRTRWARGYLQVIRGYGGKLFRGALRGSFSCFDMAMNNMPAFILSTAMIVFDVILGIWGACIGDDVMIAVRSIGQTLLSSYLLLFTLGGITVITEWKHIHATVPQKILYAFTFPSFLYTYLPIAICALFYQPKWKPIVHTMSAEELRRHGMGDVAECVKAE